MERSLSHDVPIGATQVSLAQLNERSRDIFRQIVESYLATGEPVGSRNISRLITTPLSPASVRNVMSDLEQLGLIYAPHTSAGRLPTELGLRFFVDALMEIGDLGESDRREMEAKVAAAGKSMDAVLNEASGMLSGLTRAAGVVLTAKSNVRLKHIEFVRLEPDRALVILVADDGQVENRIISVPMGLPAASLTEAANFLNAHVRGRTLAQAELDLLTQKIIAAGLASWSGGESDERKLIVRGAAHLLDDLKALEDLERVRLLFDDLETKRGVIDLLGRAERAEGAHIFIGSENKLFSLSGSSTIVAPYREGSGRIVGVLGVIGPTRLNYARVIPMVDYTAKVVSKLVAGTNGRCGLIFWASALISEAGRTTSGNTTCRIGPFAHRAPRPIRTITEPIRPRPRHRRTRRPLPPTRIPWSRSRAKPPITKTSSCVRSRRWKTCASEPNGRWRMHATTASLRSLAIFWRLPTIWNARSARSTRIYERRPTPEPRRCSTALSSPSASC